MVVDILIALIFVFCIILGAKKGFAKSIVGLCSYIVSLFIGMFFYTHFKDFLYSTPKIYQKIEMFKENISNSISNYALIKEGKLPAVFSGIINSATENISEALSEVAVSVIIAIIFMLLILIAIKILSRLLILAVKLPVLKQFNGILGGAIGGINGIIVCYIAAALLMFFVVSKNNVFISNQLETSLLATYFFENNVLINLFVGIN